MVIDTTAPTVTNVTSTTVDGSYKFGSTIPIQVVFSEDVNVTGTPQLTLNLNEDSCRLYNYSGSDILIFNYAIQVGHNDDDLDYKATDSLALNGGIITDIALNDAVLTLATPGAANSLGANKALVVDTTSPTVSTFALSDSTLSAKQQPFHCVFRKGY